MAFGNRGISERNTETFQYLYSGRFDHDAIYMKEISFFNLTTARSAGIIRSNLPQKHRSLV
jgi:hypothetical protein